MCIGYLHLNQLKDFTHMSNNKRDCFLLFNILDHICTTCLFLQIFSRKTFSNSFANRQRYKNMILRSIHKIWNSPLFQMLFLWLNESSPWRDSPPSFQEGFWNDFPFWNRYQMKLYQLKFLYWLEILKPNKIPIENFEINSITNWNNFFL
jgi:hypothetical protein